MDWDLKLGRMMEEGEAAAPVGRRRSRASSSSSGGLQQQITCLVDGCTWDLNSCREYHRRHRVCERHSKTPVVLVAGEEQRFCQQCSRFQSLGEFDDAKRSCRKRLDGHNRRRRKTQPESSVYSNTLPGPPPAPMLMRAAPMYPPSSAWEMTAPPPFYTSSAADFGHIDCALSLLSTSGTQQQGRSFPGGSTSSSNAAFDVHHDHNHNPAAPPCRMFPFTWH